VGKNYLKKGTTSRRPSQKLGHKSSRTWARRECADYIWQGIKKKKDKKRMSDAEAEVVTKLEGDITVPRRKKWTDYPSCDITIGRWGDSATA